MRLASPDDEENQVPPSHQPEVPLELLSTGVEMATIDQDSIASRIGDTQFSSIEPETYINEAQLGQQDATKNDIISTETHPESRHSIELANVPHTGQRTVQQYSKQRSSQHKTTAQAPLLAFTIEDSDNEGFSWGAAPKTGVFSLDIGKNGRKTVRVSSPTPISGQINQVDSTALSRSQSRHSVPEDEEQLEPSSLNHSLAEGSSQVSLQQTELTYSPGISEQEIEKSNHYQKHNTSAMRSATQHVIDTALSSSKNALSGRSNSQILEKVNSREAEEESRHSEPIITAAGRPLLDKSTMVQPISPSGVNTGQSSLSHKNSVTVPPKAAATLPKKVTWEKNISRVPFPEALVTKSGTQRPPNMSKKVQTNSSRHQGVLHEVTAPRSQLGSFATEDHLSRHCDTHAPKVAEFVSRKGVPSSHHGDEEMYTIHNPIRPGPQPDGSLINSSDNGSSASGGLAHALKKPIDDGDKPRTELAPQDNDEADKRRRSQENYSPERLQLVAPIPHSELDVELSQYQDFHYQTSQTGSITPDRLARYSQANLTHRREVSDSSARTSRSNNKISKFNTASQPSVTDRYRKWLAQGQDVMKKLEDYEEQKMVIEKQKVEIQRLALSDLQARDELKALEPHIAKMNDNISKAKTMAMKYQEHINEVINCQKSLKKDSSGLKASSTELARELRVLKAGVISEEAKKAAEANEFIVAKLQADITELKNDFGKANADLKDRAGNLFKKNKQLEEELNVKLIELSRERFQCERFDMRFKTQDENYRQLVQCLNSMQRSMIDRLFVDGGVVETLVASDKSTQEKLQELAIIVANLRDAEQEIQPALGKIIEQSTTSIEAKFLDLSKEITDHQASNIKLIEEAKLSIDNLSLDHITIENHNTYICKLKETIAANGADLKLKQAYCDKLKDKITHQEKELKGLCEQLKIKSAELVALEALPNDNAILREKIHELQVDKSKLQVQVDCAIEEKLSMRDETQALRELTVKAEMRIRELEEKLTNAQDSIRSVAEEKKRIMATLQKKIDDVKKETKTEFGKKADDAKKETQLRHNAEVLNLKQSLSEAEKDLKEIRAENQRNQEISATYDGNIRTLQAKISHHEDTIIKQAKKVEDLQQRPTREDLENVVCGYVEQINSLAARVDRLLLMRPNEVDFGNRAIALRSDRENLSKIQKDTTTIHDSMNQKLNSAFQKCQDVQDQLRMVNNLEVAKQTLTAENQDLRVQTHTLTNRHQELEAQVSLLNSKTLELNEQNNNLENQTQLLNSKVETLQTSEQEMRGQNITLKLNNQTLASENRGLKESSQIIEVQNSGLVLDKQSLELRLRMVEDSNKVLGREKQAIESENTKLEEQLQKLQEDTASLKEKVSARLRQDRSLSDGVSLEEWARDSNILKPQDRYEPFDQMPKGEISQGDEYHLTSKTNGISPRTVSQALGQRNTNITPHASSARRSTRKLANRKRSKLDIDRNFDDNVPGHLRSSLPSSAKSFMVTKSFVTEISQQTYAFEEPDKQLEISTQRVVNNTQSSPLSDPPEGLLDSGSLESKQRGRSPKSRVEREKSVMVNGAREYKVSTRSPRISMPTKTQPWHDSSRSDSRPEYAASFLREDENAAEDINNQIASNNTESSTPRTSVSTSVTRAKESIPLKSAMKKTTKGTQAAPTQTISLKKLSALSSQDLGKNSHRGVNQSLAQLSSESRGVSGVKGVVTGTNPASKNKGSESLGTRTPLSSQQSYIEAQPSPLMAAPARNNANKKRKASVELQIEKQSSVKISRYA